MEAYYQELGRAGRDGRPAEAFMLYGLDDIRQRRLFIEEDGQDGKGGDSDHKRREHQRLDALIAYCETSACRRRVLLSYFGDAEPAEHMAPCGNCDVCLNPPVTEDGTRSEEHTSELQSLMRISYAVFCLQKNNNHQTQ